VIEKDAAAILVASESRRFESILIDGAIVCLENSSLCSAKQMKLINLHLASTFLLPSSVTNHF